MIENNVLTIEYNRGVLTLNMDHAFKVFNQSDMKILSDTIKKCDDPEAVAAEVNGYLVDVIEKLTKARYNIYDGNDQGKKDRARLNKDIKHYAGLQNILVKHFNIEALEKDQEATATAKECESYIFENHIVPMYSEQIIPIRSISVDEMSLSINGDIIVNVNTIDCCFIRYYIIIF